MPRSATMRLLRDEWIGFARSKVMIVLWVLLPLLAITGYFLFKGNKEFGGENGGHPMTANTFMTLVESGLSGPIAALMVAVDLVSERQRKVYELFVIRPVRREAILWAKFLAVFSSVTFACLVSIALGIGVDAVRGEPLPPSGELLKSLVSMTGVVMLSTATGVFVGSVSRTILIAVIILQFGGGNLAVVPMLPMYLGYLPNLFWLFMLITLGMAGGLLWLAGWMFRRAEF